jgi:predicted transcriptional regulator
MGRPRIYASDAERQAAHRARHAITEVRLDGEMVDTLDRIAAQLDVKRTVVIESMLKYALLNRDWTRSLFKTKG